MRLTPEQVKKIIETASPDLTVAEIAYYCGLKWTQVIPVLNRRKIKYKPEKNGAGNFAIMHTQEQKDRMRQLASDNLCASELAKMIGSTRQRVAMFLKQNNLPVKSQKNARYREKEEVKGGCFDWKEAKQIDNLFFAA